MCEGGLDVCMSGIVFNAAPKPVRSKRLDDDAVGGICELRCTYEVRSINIRHHYPIHNGRLHRDAREIR